MKIVMTIALFVIMSENVFASDWKVYSSESDNKGEIKKVYLYNNEDIIPVNNIINIWTKEVDAKKVYDFMENEKNKKILQEEIFPKIWGEGFTETNDAFYIRVFEVISNYVKENSKVRFIINCGEKTWGVTSYIGLDKKGKLKHFSDANPTMEFIPPDSHIDLLFSQVCR